MIIRFVFVGGCQFSDDVKVIQRSGESVMSASHFRVRDWRLNQFPLVIFAKVIICSQVWHLLINDYLLVLLVYFSTICVIGMSSTRSSIGQRSGLALIL
jgi:hypothetical protein